MTLEYIQKVIENIMKEIENIDFYKQEQRRNNQKQIQKAYFLLDKFRDELIREQIKNK